MTALRKPTPAEAALLGVYLDAEQAVLAEIACHTRSVVDNAEAGRDIDAARAMALADLRAAIARIVVRLDLAAPAQLAAVLTAARTQGAAAAAAELALVTGAAAGGYDAAIPRGPLDRLAAAVVDRVTLAHHAILRTSLDAFRDITARATPGVLVGSETRRQATQRAMWAYADRGITGFTDVSGRRWSLSAYAEMAVRTAAARAMEDAKHDRLRSAGIDLVMVQAADDRCPVCRPWAGAVLSISTPGARTVQVEHATRDGVMVDVEVAGSVGEARAAGVFHPQCRCSTAAYQPGVTRRPPPAKDNGQYAARQRQRAIERQIRAYKARQVAALDADAARRAVAQVRAAQARMRAHLAENPDLRRLSHREQLGAGNLPVGSTRPVTPTTR